MTSYNSTYDSHELYQLFISSNIIVFCKQIHEFAHTHAHTHIHIHLRYNMGYVTHSQFRQCLSYLGLGASEEERRVVEMRFSDSKGFNYLQFLEEL